MRVCVYLLYLHNPTVSYIYRSTGHLGLTLGEKRQPGNKRVITTRTKRINQLEKCCVSSLSLALITLANA